MLTLKTVKQCQMIVNNVLKACKDINQLNKQGYNFLYLCSGFIAHYNLYGFIDYYKFESLERDILRFKNNNQWSNFRIGEKDSEYYHQMRDIYNTICKQLEKEYLFN
jgi:hypothetical protein